MVGVAEPGAEPPGEAVSEAPDGPLDETAGIFIGASVSEAPGTGFG